MAQTRTLLVLGDSLTAGFGLPADKSFPAQLEAFWRAQGLAVKVINAGVSGDTSAGGLARLDWALGARPDAAIVELGANDALRGVEPAAMEANLDAILARMKARGIKILLAGMRAPPNLGRDYGRDFEAVFPRLAARHGALLYPFFLEGVAGEPRLNLPDGMHPTAEGVSEIVRRVAPVAKALLE